jgi:hypothetical protein
MNKQTDKQSNKPTNEITNIWQYEIKSNSLKLNKNCIDHYRLYLISAMVQVSFYILKTKKWNIHIEGPCMCTI